jgi:hypothetical protein
MTSDEMYERVREINYCMIELNKLLKPLRQELIDLSKQFMQYYNERERLEKQLIKITVIPMGVSGRKPFMPKVDTTSLDVKLTMMSKEDLLAFITKAKAMMEGGGV